MILSTHPFIRLVGVTTFIAVALTFSPALSQNTQTITLDQAIKMGMEASHQLKIANANLDYAKAIHDQTFDQQYPSLKLSVAYDRLSDVTPFQFQFPGSNEPITVFPIYLNSFQNRLSLNQVIFAGFRVKTAKESAGKILAASQYDLAQEAAEVKMNVIAAYYNLYKVQQSVNIILQNKKLIDLALNDVQNFVKNGMATHNDELQMELQQSNTELSLIDARNVLDEANYNFNLLVGLPDDVQVTLDTTSLFNMKSTATKDEFVSKALQLRPEVLSLQLRSDAARDNLKIAQNGDWPSLSVGADLLYASPNARYIPPTDVFKTTWDVGLTLNWNITNLFTNKHSIAANHALVDQATASLSQLKDGIKSEVMQNYLSYSQALQKLIVLQKAVATAEENLTSTQSRYKNGVALIRDLSDAQTQQIQSEINLVVAKADAQIAYYKLQKSSGTF